MKTPRLIVGISGASGAIYATTLLRALRVAGIESHLVVSRSAHITLSHELNLSLAQIQQMADVTYAIGDMAARIASGSFKTSGMIIAPCSMRSLAEIATANTTTLLTRAADVVLKERRRLVLLTRETPLHSAHLRNMLAVSDMGGIIAPPMPAFYQQPSTLQGLVDHTVGRVLDLFDIEHTLVRRWNGLDSPPESDDAE